MLGVHVVLEEDGFLAEDSPDLMVCESSDGVLRLEVGRDNRHAETLEDCTQDNLSVNKSPGTEEHFILNESNYFVSMVSTQLHETFNFPLNSSDCSLWTLFNLADGYDGELIININTQKVIMNHCGVIIQSPLMVC